MTAEITVTFTDGTEETYQADNQLQVNGPVLMIPQGSGGSHVAIVLGQVRKWEVVVSKIETALKLPQLVKMQ